MLGTHTNLPALLQLYFRDDLSAWAVKRSGGRGGGGPALPREQLKQLCAANADACLQRLRAVRGLLPQNTAHRLSNISSLASCSAAAGIYSENDPVAHAERRSTRSRRLGLPSQANRHLLRS